MRDGGCFAQVEAEFLREVVQRLAIGLADGGGHLVRDVVGFRVHLLVEDGLEDRVANLLEVLVWAVSRSRTLMMWKPYWVLTRSEIAPLGRLKAACWNSGTVWPSTIQPRSPPLGLVASSSEYFLARSSKLAPLLGLLQHVFGLLANFGDFGVGLADGLEENVLDMNAVFDFVLVDVAGCNRRAERRR